MSDEQSELVPLATRVSTHLRRAVKVRAALEERAVQELVAQALHEYLDNHEEPRPPSAAGAVTPQE